jgi:hypothetical protein
MLLRLPRTETRQRLEKYLKIRRYKQTEIGLHQMTADHAKQQSTGIFPLIATRRTNLNKMLRRTCRIRICQVSEKIGMVGHITAP